MNRDKVQAEALEATRGKDRCGLALATGVGKTLVALNHLEEHYSPLLNILVVAPKKSIFDSWRTEAQKFDKEKLLINITFSTYLSRSLVFASKSTKCPFFISTMDIPEQT